MSYYATYATTSNMHRRNDLMLQELRAKMNKLSHESEEREFCYAMIRLITDNDSAIRGLMRKYTDLTNQQ